MHTMASDGAWSSAAMMLIASKAGMSTVAVTDHDTVTGVEEAVAVGSALGMCVIPGLELSTGDHEEIHLLVYGVSSHDPALNHMLKQSMQDRYDRMLEMLKKLEAMDMMITPEEASNKSTVFTGRMNLAQAMVSHGYVSTVREAFDKYLGMNRAAFVPRKRMRVPDAIESMRSLHYLVSLAHPGRLVMGKEELSFRLPGWVEAGLSAIEVYHPSHSYADIQYFRQLADMHGLLITGGSDCHGRKASGNAQIGDNMRLWFTAEEDTASLVEALNSLQCSISARIRPERRTGMI